MSSPKPQLALEHQDVSELFVVTSHENTVVAVPARAVSRLLLAEDLTSLTSAVLVIDGRGYAVWDLGRLLAMSPAQTACLLLEIPNSTSADRPGESVPIALFTGPCLCVEAISSRTPIPAGLFPSRPGALTSAFATQLLSRPAPALVGFIFDAVHALSASELRESLARVRNAEAG